ncbi:YIPF3 [Asbolus verrucosus]|uniref:YIPF3 n=1 Tax=Asbolus verrucosus TaxID=1661398 RepID=A0A482VSR7_ASBVE|nr:YIPF3 [Asbolus verrucosus]
MANSVIFIGSPEKSPKNLLQTLKQVFYVSPNDVIFRIFAAFVPPVGKNYKKIYVDLQGPLLALLILVAFHSQDSIGFFKNHSFASCAIADLLIYIRH